ncbi:MAG: GLUG motif-containing protein [Planctomycetota bacterium]
MRITNSFFALVVALSLCVLCGVSSGFSGAGSGTQADPYVITTLQQLQEMNGDLDAHYILGNDIDASETRTWTGGAGFEPVGNSTDPFTGKFDGRMFTITGLYINRPTTDLVGLFGYITDGAVVQSVGLAEVDVTARRNSGPLVGSSSGATVCYCWSSGNIRGSHNYQMRLGGLIGISSNADSYVYQCFSSVNVTATGGAHQVGGLAGYNGHGSIMSDCYATGDVSGHWKVGGLVGDNPYPEGGYITRCYSTGKVSGTGGGLVGFNYRGGVTYDSYWDTETSGKSSSYGGVGKTTAEMMQQATFVGWDFVDIWNIVEDQTYPFLGPYSPRIAAISGIKDAIREKEELLADIEAVIEREQAAYDALDRLLAGGDYGDLSRGDIIKAQQEIHSAIQHEQQSKDALEKSIERLYDALAALGWAPPATDE